MKYLLVRYLSATLIVILLGCIAFGFLWLIVSYKEESFIVFNIAMLLLIIHIVAKRLNKD